MHKHKKISSMRTEEVIAGFAFSKAVPQITGRKLLYRSIKFHHKIGNGCDIFFGDSSA